MSIPVGPDQPATAPPPTPAHSDATEQAGYSLNGPVQARRYPPQPTKPTGTATVIFGVISLVGAVAIAFLGLAAAFLYFFVGPTLPAVLAVLVGIIGALASAKTRRRRIVVFCAVQGAGLLLVLAVIVGRFWFRFLDHYYFLFIRIGGEFFFALVILAGAIGVIVSGARAHAHAASTRAIAAAPPQPAGYAADGRPFYPIVGYASDGTPITADQALGYRPSSAGTNAMAITAFILAFTTSVLAIPFGHVARAQIRRTGEQGAGLALAALIIGYTSGGILLIVGITLAVTLAN